MHIAAIRTSQSAVWNSQRYKFGKISQNACLIRLVLVWNRQQYKMKQTISVQRNCGFSQWVVWDISTHPLLTLNVRKLKEYRPKIISSLTTRKKSCDGQLRKFLKAISLFIFLKGTIVQFSSVQDGIYALGKTHMRSTSSFRSFPNVAFGTVPMFVWLTMALSRPFKEDHLALSLTIVYSLLKRILPQRHTKIDIKL